MLSPTPVADGTEIIVAAAHLPLSVQFEAIELRVLAGPDAGQEISLGLPSVRIGTASDNDLLLTDRAISRRHAEIRMTPDGLLLRDLGSTNGTFINDVRITEAYIPEHAECRLGYTRLSIRQHTEERKVAVPRQDHLGELVGASERMRELYGLIRAVAPTPTTVHLHGESGAGKESVARTLHGLSSRRGPLVVFDASVTDPEMVRNDLFGHIKGAFTGATGSREGAFRQANNGTLFIDEIGELPLDLQPRLLRVLETREVIPIGSDKPLRVDVRVITATHRDLESMVKDGTFRADLFYRLSVVPIELPALREIAEDIPLIAHHLCERLQLNSRISDTAMAALQNYAWPGNVRELRNVLERAAVMCGEREIQPDDLRLPKELAPSKGNAPAATPLAIPPTIPVASTPKPSAAAARAQLKEIERRMIVDALERNQNNKAAVARELGIPLSTLKRRLKEYQIGEED
ncbi:Sigma54 specific transcriptional regulator, Fis family [Candidatus Competibacter denitrificans Run_A_D11]|uniref:Sigma54 specific transcriptional regulator, Fis family n=1 Tax=Candidatus Competibacter denitrificans Run_A_D11 TaxID=1400863 RepID=W6M3J8_9GAMM|nr:sigma 54-interacting transcriptional regulator [Candidatus Competibacter denitrificans]CDI02202.1 Sigma54 specific transcriptional regulator, Fis family [Candidatus Competibacter denitrificans Run_A_D11]HRC68472.1 sigma 54-interacting transcriptional regulator [Candidatus Competibacter denitrificans]